MAVIKRGHPLFAKVLVKDVMGKTVAYVSKYNTKTKEATVYVQASREGIAAPKFIVSGNSTLLASGGKNKVATATTKLVGSYLVDRKTGKKVTV